MQNSYVMRTKVLVPVQTKTDEGGALTGIFVRTHCDFILLEHSEKLVGATFANHLRLGPYHPAPSPESIARGSADRSH